MEVHELSTGGDPYRAIHLLDDDWEAWRMLDRTESLLASWSPPRMRFYEPGETGLRGDTRRRPLSKDTDMPTVFGALMVLVSERFIAQHGETFSRFGEFLRCDCAERPFFVYHCTNELAALDERRSVVSRSSSTRRILNVDEYHFHRDAIPEDAIFRLNTGNRYLVFVTGTIEKLIKRPPMQGVTSQMVWSSD